MDGLHADKVTNQTTICNSRNEANAFDYSCLMSYFPTFSRFQKPMAPGSDPARRRVFPDSGPGPLPLAPGDSCSPVFSLISVFHA
jgi:hypothetical protein